MEPKILEKLGLTRNESIVYLSLLQLGTSKTGKILESSRLNSGKIYEILNSLKIKGLVSESIINNIRHFTASPPSQLLEYIEKKKEAIELEEKSIKPYLNQLEKLQKETAKEVKASTYIGFRGLKTAATEILEILSSKDEVLSLGMSENKEPLFKNFWLNWENKRIQKKIPARYIFYAKKEQYTNYKKLKLTKSKIITKFKPVDIDIYGKDKIMIINYAEPITCILIHDENTATNFRNFFEQLWKISQ
jgi:sugar-specific transcriptional regulator TrmB|tara:strand:- start:1872 stop:2615 length:744 start_codon:yes stop_codon:yes gene_type:complete